MSLLDFVGSVALLTIYGRTVRAYVSGVSCDRPDLWPNGSAYIVVASDPDDQRTHRIDCTSVTDAQPAD